MSLIEEALRRVQDPLVESQQKPSGKTATGSTTAPNSSTSPTSVHPWQSPTAAGGPARVSRESSAPIAIALIVLVFTAGLIVGGGVWMAGRLRTHQTTPAAQTVTLPTSTPSTASSNPTTSPASVTAAPGEEFALTGVVEGSGNPYAVINGSIVSIGEPIGNATLVRIADGLVTLRRANGQEVTLRVPR